MPVDELTPDDGTTPRGACARARAVTPSRSAARRPLPHQFAARRDRSRRTAPIRRCKSVCRALDVLRTVNKLRIASVHGDPRGDRLSQADHRADARDAGGRRLCRARQHVRRLPRHQPRAEAQLRLPGHLADHRGGAAVRDRADAPAQMADRHRRASTATRSRSSSGPARSARGRTPTRCSGCGPTCVTTAMGRAYLAFCSGRRARAASAPPARRSAARFRREPRSAPARDPASRCAATATRRAIRSTKPYRTTTLAMPIREGETVHALISISFFTTAVAKRRDRREDRGAAAGDDDADRSSVLAFYACGHAAGQQRPGDRAAVELGVPRLLVVELGVRRRRAALEPVSNLRCVEQPVAVAVA